MICNCDISQGNCTILWMLLSIFFEVLYHTWWRSRHESKHVAKT